MFEVTGAGVKVTQGSDHDVAQLDPGMNMYAKLELLAASGQET